MGLTPRHPDSPDVIAWQQETENGDIPRATLEEITPPQIDPDLQGPAVLYPPAAAAMSDLLAAAKDAGHPMRVEYSYRTLAKQREKWDNFKFGDDGKPRTGDEGNVAAEVGTSNHGEGLAVDFTDLSSSDVTWLVNHAWEYRFDNGDVSDEDWHWTYRGGYVSEDEMTEEERAEFDEMKKTIKMHERFITALLEGLGSEQKPATFEGGGKRVAKAVRQTEE